MSSKRVVAREWKRKKKQQQRVVKLSIAAVCIVAILGIGYIAWDMWSRTYVMTFEGQRISREDMRFFAMMADGTWDPRAQAVESLTQYLLINQAASRHNVTLTSEELAATTESVSEAQMMLDMFGAEMQAATGIAAPDLPEERMLELSSLPFLSAHLMDIYTADFELNEDEFSLAALDFVPNNRDNFVEMDFRYHFSESMNAARIAWDDLVAADPEEWDDIITRDMQLDDVMGGLEIEGLDMEGIEIEIPVTIPTVTLNDLRHDLDPQTIDRLIALNVGDFTEPMQLGEGFYVIFIADSYFVPTDDEIAEIFREDYIFQQRIQIFTDVMNGWREAADIRINERGVNAA